MRDFEAELKAAEVAMENLHDAWASFVRVSWPLEAYVPVKHDRSLAQQIDDLSQEVLNQT